MKILVFKNKLLFNGLVRLRLFIRNLWWFWKDRNGIDDYSILNSIKMAWILSDIEIINSIEDAINNMRKIMSDDESINILESLRVSKNTDKD